MSGSEHPPEPVSHGAIRLATVIDRGRRATSDFRSLDSLCAEAHLGIGPRTLRRWCAAERVAARNLLVFARLARAISFAADTGATPSEYLDADERTIKRLLTLAGAKDREAYSLATLIAEKRLLGNPVLKDEIRKALLDVSKARSPARP